MQRLAFLRYLDHQPNALRRVIIEEHLAALGCPFQQQAYATGTNLVVDLGPPGPKIGLGSHFDRVLATAGANDNGSALAVALEIVRRHRETRSALGVRVFFFDEEETGLRGSRAYVAQHGVADLAGLLNLEMVGQGNQFALWPVAAEAAGPLLAAFEATARQQGVPAHRFDQIVTNTADHVPFRQAGLPAASAFTLTCVSDQDLAAAQRYYRALAQGAHPVALAELLAQAPLFRHYHQPTDTAEKLSETTLALAADAVWATLGAA